jgi:uncharacterized protein YdeI (YjbR/CyaY-like superfamily)
METPELHLPDQASWEEWLSQHGETSGSVWLFLRKKGGSIPCPSYAEALDSALCFGWIDGQIRGGDQNLYSQRFSPRGKRSIWSKINREHIARLTAAGRVRPAGLREVERAKADGRWDAAYDPASQAVVPGDLEAALSACPAAAAAFLNLDRGNRYAILFRIQTVKKAEIRSRKIAEYVAMLARGERIHP